MVGVGASEAMTVPLIAVADLERFGLSTDGTVEATAGVPRDGAGQIPRQWQQCGRWTRH